MKNLQTNVPSSAPPTTFRIGDFPSKFLKNIGEEQETVGLIKPGPIDQDNTYEIYQRPKSQIYYPPTSMAKEL
uniref:Uncharacterized protein n=1 Tax=Romanomermis culicivorax TaxID=13658 RepID=A0A915HWZ0_ROMCU